MIYDVAFVHDTLNDILSYFVQTKLNYLYRINNS